MLPSSNKNLNYNGCGLQCPSWPSYQSPSDGAEHSLAGSVDSLEAERHHKEWQMYLCEKTPVFNSVCVTYDKNKI